jgi:uncharacterized membrane protein YkoI
MKKLVLGTAIAVGAVLALSGPVLSDSKSEKKKDGVKEKLEMAGEAKVSIDQAIKAALDKVPGKVIEAELEKKHDKTVWEVEVVTAENKVMEVHVDADSGAVIDVEEEGEQDKERKHDRKREHH